MMTTTDPNATAIGIDAPAADAAATAAADSGMPPPRTARARVRKSDTAADVDAELDAMAQCTRALSTLDATACGRVLLYLARRYDPAPARAGGGRLNVTDVASAAFEAARGPGGDDA